MSDSDLIIETSTNQFKCLSSDDQTIHLHFRGLVGDNPTQTFSMSKAMLHTILNRVTNDPLTVNAYGSFNPNND
ncbi:hypothetical protein [Flavobacterium soyangense]|uniref:Uncharacterized protein n=1 Tax=Flavobacterium soyangense TaxID=2023265 RepID=A0A930U948_9FLAO|nr:hypothetical protein [Flavobacterium soyangense]MBF2707767.1 hypothetical protein [Flavobacterium soyangense]